MHWERIEPVAESFGDLDPKLDLREADLEEGQEWTGWHRIEKDLWPPADGYTALTPAERTAVADQLVADTADAGRRGSQDLTFTADQLGNGAKELLDEVATGKVTGEEEIWSHTDLWDFQANVDGARVAFEALQPVVEQKDAGAGRRRSTQRFAALQALLDQYRDGDGFVLYTDLTAGAGQGARRRGRRAGRAAVEADGRRRPVTGGRRARPGRPRARLSRRASSARGAAGAAAAAGVAGGRVARRRATSPAASGTADGAVPVLRRAPGRHRHAGPGPAALRRVRRHDRPPRSELVALLHDLDRGGGADDPGRRAPGPYGAGRAARTTHRRTTPARRSACRRRG